MKKLNFDGSDQIQTNRRFWNLTLKPVDTAVTCHYAHLDAGLIAYSILAGDEIAGPFELSVQDVPVVAIQSVHYDPPDYSRQSAWTGSGGTIQALDGTQVTIRATTNRPVVKAKIEFNPRPLGDSVQATAGATELNIEPDGTSLSVVFPLRSARGRSAAVELESYRISVWDASDQRNPEPIIYPIRVVTDLPPEIAIMLPTVSPKDLPIDSQQVIQIYASDPDFGLQQISLEIRSGIDLIAEPILWSDKAGEKGNQVAEYRMRPAEHGLRIGDTVNVIAIATDNRLLQHDRSVEPNTARTDAIELKIVASQPAPRAGDPEADGVSAPDDRPASDKGEDNSGASSGEGAQQQGGGGSEGEGKKQQGESQGGDQQSNQSGESGDGDGETSGGESSDRNEGGESSPENPSSSGEGTSSSDDRQPTGDQPTDKTGDQSSSDQSTGDSQQSEPGSEPSDQERGQQLQEPGSQGQGKPNDNANQPSGDAKSADRSSGADSDPENRSGQGPSENQTSEPGSEQSNSEQSGDRDEPQHDGEAFERIREHLEQKRKAQNQSKRESDKPETGAGQSNADQQGPESGSPKNPHDSSQESGSEGASNPQGQDQPSGEGQDQPSGEGPRSAQCRRPRSAQCRRPRSAQCRRPRSAQCRRPRSAQCRRPAVGSQAVSRG